MKKISTLLCMAFATAMMACNAGNTSSEASAQEPAEATAEAQVETIFTPNDMAEKSTKVEQSVVLKPKSDTQIRPDMKVLRPTVIDFNATWCGPCRLFGPAFDKVAEKYSNKVDFYSIDTDVYPETATAFSIQAIPTVTFILPDGTVQTHVGLGDFLTTLTSDDPSQEEMQATMANELAAMIQKF